MSALGLHVGNGDLFQITYKIYIVDNGNKWGSNPPITHYISYGGISTAVDVAYDTTVSVDTGVLTSTAASSSILQWNFASLDTNDYPQADAVFYIKDVQLQIWTMG